MVASFDVEIGTHEDVVLAVGIVGKCRVIATRSIGDAASPVYVQAGDHQENAGQVADYRHDIEVAAKQRDCRVAVSGFYADDHWEQTVIVMDGSLDEQAVRAQVSALVQRDRAKEEAAERAAGKVREQKRQAAWMAREQIIKNVVEAAVAEWAPGRTSVWQGGNGRWYVGRWNEPFIPGHGPASETREVIVSDLTRFEGESPSFSAKMNTTVVI